MPGARQRTRPSRCSICSCFEMISLRFASASGRSGILPSAGSTPAGRTIAPGGSFGRSFRLYENSPLARFGGRVIGTSGVSMFRGSGMARYSPPMSGWPSGVRTPDGQPDIGGLYLAIPLPRNIETPLVPITRPPNRANGEFSYSLNERPKLPPGAIVRPAGVDPADGRIPLRPEALAKRKDIISKQEQIEHLDGRVLCLAPGIPRSTVPAPVVGYQIFQKPGAVVIFYEQSHLYRTIPLDGRPPLDPNIRKAMGVSRGRWEGNVLVVEVTNFTNNLENNWVIG